MANTCAICGASINIFQSQKLADGNYLCRKTCCEKAMRNFDLVTATLPQFKMHAAQVERETMLWEKIFVPRRKNKSMKSNFYPFMWILTPDLWLCLRQDTNSCGSARVNSRASIV